MKRNGRLPQKSGSRRKLYLSLIHIFIAMQIERKAEDCYKAEYARRHLGECYEGRISGVTQRGLFIELENSL